MYECPKLLQTQTEEYQNALDLSRSLWEDGREGVDLYSLGKLHALERKAYHEKYGEGQWHVVYERCPVCGFDFLKYREAGLSDDVIDILHGGWAKRA